MKRREFITKTIAGSALVSLGGISEGFSTPGKKITILHTNDVHSYIDPFPIDHPRNPGRGGAARRASLIDSIRQENPNTILLDAGDIFQGTPYFNYYGGALEFKLMSMMKYDLATMGNHDFDNGIDGFYSMLEHANFGFVSANYDFSRTILKNVVAPYRILKKAGLKIGVFGLGVELVGLVDKKLYGETRYQDPVGVANEMVSELQRANCDLVICLSHLGYEYKNDKNKISDVKLAGLTQGIDLIIGGHTHTFLDKPTVLQNAQGKEVIVNQTGCYGLNLGRIDFYFDRNSKTSRGRTIVV
jgi:5'-nucleotidase